MLNGTLYARVPAPQLYFRLRNDSLTFQTLFIGTIAWIEKKTYDKIIFLSCEMCLCNEILKLK